MRVAPERRTVSTYSALFGYVDIKIKCSDVVAMRLHDRMCHHRSFRRREPRRTSAPAQRSDQQHRNHHPDARRGHGARESVTAAGPSTAQPRSGRSKLYSHTSAAITPASIFDSTQMREPNTAPPQSIYQKRPIQTGHTSATAWSTFPKLSSSVARGHPRPADRLPKPPTLPSKPPRRESR